MYTALLLLASAASAADIVQTDIRAATDYLHPAVLVGFNPQPDPPVVDFANAGRVATSTLAFERQASVGFTIGVAEDRAGVRSIALVDGRDRVVVFGEGAVERFLPPGPCFQLIATLGDGTDLAIDVRIDSSGGFVDPGSLVGFNPQPDPPGFPAAVALSFGAYARGEADLSVSVSLSSEGEVLAIY